MSCSLKLLVKKRGGGFLLLNWCKTNIMSEFQLLDYNQPVLITRGVHVQQTIVIALPINILITTRLPICGNGVPI